MLAISRALLTNPHLLVMDEPTEGLAPVIVAQVEEMLVRLGEEGDIAVLVIEQNIGVATAVAEQRRDHGQRPRSTASSSCARLAADRDLQQRLLGVGRHSEATGGRGGSAAATPRERRPRPRPAPSAARSRVYVSNPIPPTRWSQPVPIARIEAARAHALRPASRGSTKRPRDARSPTRRAVGPPAGARRRHARHQGRGAALHPGPRRRERACARGWSTSRRAASRSRRRHGAGNRAQSPRGGAGGVRPAIAARR